MARRLSIAAERKAYIAPIFTADLMLRFAPFAATILASLSVFCAGPAAAHDRRVPSSGAELRLSNAPIVQRAQPAVVNVYAGKTVQNRNHSCTILFFAASPTDGEGTSSLPSVPSGQNSIEWAEGAQGTIILFKA